MQRLFAIAHEMGVTIEMVNHLTPERPGVYIHNLRLIQVLDGMTLVKTMCVTAHELGHAHYADLPSIFDRHSQRQEDRADEWAALLLIDHREYRLAEEKYGSNTKWIAQELGVLPRIINAYEGTLSRIGDTIYVKPTLGAASMKMPA